MLTRKEFLKGTVEVSAAVFGLTLLHGCGSDYSGGGKVNPAGPSPSNPDCLDNGTESTIGYNHGHVLVVSADDVAAAADKTYHIRGTADHDHTVTITQAQFGTLGGNQAIMIISSYDPSASYGPHDHSVMVACASA